MMCWCLHGELKSGLIEIFHRDFDVGGEGNESNDDYDDIYIMMKCLFVGVSRKMITSHFQAERRRRKVSRPLGLAGRRPALA